MFLRSMFLSVLLVASAAQAEVYKHVDEQGRVTYSNSPIPGGKKLDLEPLTTISLPPARTPSKAGTATPAPEPAETGQVRLLRQELALEEEKLAKAREALASGSTGASRPPGGEGIRNVADQDAQARALQDWIDFQAKKVNFLKTELDRVAPSRASPGGAR